MNNQYKLSLEDAIEVFENAYYSNSSNNTTIPDAAQRLFMAGHPLLTAKIPRKNFYCGITNDLNRRMGEHNAKPLVWVKARNQENAIMLEEALGEKGYDIGSVAGNGAADDSVIVYMYKKSLFTNEH